MSYSSYLRRKDLIQRGCGEESGRKEGNQSNLNKAHFLTQFEVLLNDDEEVGIMDQLDNRNLEHTNGDRSNLTKEERDPGRKGRRLNV